MPVWEIIRKNIRLRERLVKLLEKLGALRVKGRLLALLSLLSGFFVLTGLAGTYLYWGLQPPGGGREVIVTIPKGVTTTWVAGELRRHGLIRSAAVFRLYASLYNLDKRIVSGTYRLSSDMPVPTMIARLVRGDVVRVRFTIPEGLTVDEIALRLERQGIVPREEFLRVAAEGRFTYPFLPRDLKGKARLEGYLFPDTYEVSPGATAAKVIDLMLRRFEAVAAEIDLAGGATRQGLSLHQAVTLASLVEREAKLGAERPLIAGVLYNRLRRGMLLQVDATVAYALGGHRERIFYRDLAVDSPYNTYQVVGLPPGPIAAPGRASLLAVIHPQQTDYLYYVAKPDGSHAFARTLAEHNANKRRYQPSP